MSLPDPNKTSAPAAPAKAAPPPKRPPSQSTAQRKAEAARWWLVLLLQPLLLLAAGVALIAGLGLAQRFGWITGSGGGHAHVEAKSDDVTYICPMMCTPPQKEPGRCPVCAMELVPASSGGGGDRQSIRIDPATRRVANIRTMAAKKVPLTGVIHAVGELRYDEGSLKTIAAYVDGRLDRLYADYTGVEVNEGDHLALVYSPQLFTSQAEFLLARKARDDSRSATLQRVIESNNSLYESSRQRLISLGMTQQQIHELEQAGEANSRVHLCAPISGTVIEKTAAEGEYVKEGQPICKLADLSTVWLMLQLFPEDAAAVHFGQKVEAEVQSLPGRKFTGRVAFIDPDVDPRTRTVGVRVVIPNPDRLLRVGDYAKAAIEVRLTEAGTPRQEIFDPELADKWISPRHPHIVASSPGACPLCGIALVPAAQYGFTDEPDLQDQAIVVPRDAVLMAGDNSVVYVETKPGRFEIRRVVLGPAHGDQVVVLRGISEGEQVAIRGNFLIDSQMQLAGNPSLIDPARFVPETGSGLSPEALSPEALAAISKLSEADASRATAQRICPVTRLPLGSMGTPKKVNVQGASVFICCEGCRQRLLADPEKYLANLAVRPQDQSVLKQGVQKHVPTAAEVDADLPPIGPIEVMEETPSISPPNESSISNRDSAVDVERALRRLPAEDRRLALRQRICPVAETPLGSMGTPIKVTVAGRTVFICCEACRDPLLAEPARYLARLPGENLR